MGTRWSAGAASIACAIVLACPVAAATSAAQAHDLFLKLLPAAELSPQDVAFTIVDNDRCIHYHEADGGPPRLEVPLRFLNASDPSILLFALAHEMAHAVQDHRNIGGLQRLAWTYSFKQIEAHADMAGGQIAFRAGYPVETYLSGMEAWATCDSIRNPVESDHPKNQDRWLNLLAYEKPIASAPTIALDAFWSDGTFRPSSLVPIEAKRRYLQAIAAAGLPIEAVAKDFAQAFPQNRDFGKALDAALDSIIEPSDARGAIARSCGSSAGRDAPEIQAALDKVLQGDSVWLLKQLPQ